MVSTCQDSGLWLHVNITCLAVSSVPWNFNSEIVPRRSSDSGRALNYDVLRDPRNNGPFTKDNLNSNNQFIDIYKDNNNDNSNSGESSLVMGLAIVASLLLVALLVLLSVVAVRRRYLLTSPGSLNPLIKTQFHNHKKHPPPPNFYDNSTMRSVRDESNYNGGSMNNGNRTPLSSSLYQHNILSTIGHNVPDVTNAVIVIQDNSSLSGSINRLDEPPYERVRSRSEHSYETIRKLSQRVVTDDADDEMLRYQQEPSYERLAGDKGSLWYESVDKASVGYETVPGDRIIGDHTNLDEVSSYQIQERMNCTECKNLDDPSLACPIHKVKDPGYEKIKEKDHQYETLKEKEAGYESVSDTKIDPGYDTMPKNPTLHGYETVKPKQAVNFAGASDCSAAVPDILQDIEVEEGSNSIEATATVPPEILALYAQVDKSKKRKKTDKPKPSESLTENTSHYSSPDTSLLSNADYSEISNNTRPTPPPRPKGMAPPPLQVHHSAISASPAPSLKHPSIHHTQSDSSIRSPSGSGDVGSKARDFSGRFMTKMSAEDLTRPPSAASDCTSLSGTLRPLPPIPKQ